MQEKQLLIFSDNQQSKNQLITFLTNSKQTQNDIYQVEYENTIFKFKCIDEIPNTNDLIVIVYQLQNQSDILNRFKDPIQQMNKIFISIPHFEQNSILLSETIQFQFDDLKQQDIFQTILFKLNQTTNLQKLTQQSNIEIEQQNIFFINVNSGHKMGKKILKYMIELNDQQVYILQIGNQTDILYKFTHQNPRIFIVGGDGTFNSIMSQYIEYSNLIFYLIPTGTGNDLGLQLKIKPVKSLKQFQKLYKQMISKPNYIKLDSWSVYIDNNISKNMFNYLSFGIDAKIAYDFEIKRNDCFLPNKVMYFFIGLNNLIKRSVQNMSKVLTVYISQNQQINENSKPQQIQQDQENSNKNSQSQQIQQNKENSNIQITNQIELKKSANLLISNIQSFAGGGCRNFFKPRDNQKIAEFNDKLFEINCIKNNFKLMLCCVNLSRPKNLDQANNIHIKININTYLQIDGEAQIINKNQKVDVYFKKQVQVYCNIQQKIVQKDSQQSLKN